MHLAVGTSLATIVPTSLRSFLSHHARGAVDGALLRAWAPPMFLGAGAGAWFAALADSRTLIAVFAGAA